jgi:hypothetical protein
VEHKFLFATIKGIDFVNIFSAFSDRLFYFSGCVEILIKLANIK